MIHYGFRNLLFLAIMSWSIQLQTAKEFSTLQHLKPSASDSTQTEAAQELIGRIAKERANDFVAIVKQNLCTDTDCFMLIIQDGKLQITGTTGVAVSMGFYYYLTHYCNSQFTWGGENINIPSPLPQLPSETPLMVKANDKFRYYQNVCTVSYSFVWYNWTDWERQIDWMAMHGINLPLAFTGQEAIFLRAFMKFGLTFEEIQDSFAGPAFLAWARMGNMHAWGGPLPQEWMDTQLALQHRILQRMRSLGMIPVLPGFAGHVPNAILKRYPNVNVSHSADWGSFDKPYCCVYLLDFEEPLFKQIGAEVIRQIINEFGTDHIYNIDTFNEMNPKSGNLTYLSKASKAVYESIKEADSKGIWLMQGWLFLSSFWTKDRAKAYLTGVPQGEMIVLDLSADASPIMTRLDSYFGQPYIWCMLHNFGGTNDMFGSLPTINVEPFNGRTFPESTMVGIGMTPEGINQNEIVYEFFMENTWRTAPVYIDKWVSKFIQNRYDGRVDNSSQAAWRLLAASIYNAPTGVDSHDQNAVSTIRPRLHPMITPNIWYEPNQLFHAWTLLAESADSHFNGTLFRYDLVDITRNSLQLIIHGFYQSLVNAFNSSDLYTLKVMGQRIMDAINDLETVLASDSHFLLGRWTAAARAKASDAKNALLYEFNARNQITLWGPQANILDYASKQWSGLTRSYYAPRWNLFINKLMESLSHNTTFNQSAFDTEVFETIESGFSYNTDVFPTEPVGDPIQIARDLNRKYSPDLRFVNSLWKKTKVSKIKTSDCWMRKFANRSPINSNKLEK